MAAPPRPSSPPLGPLFIIDSRITASDRDGHVVSQYPGCKVLLARPTILLAGVGVEDTTGRAGHWNSLDEAAAALKRLPENPTKEQLTKWSDDWGRSLWNHYRQGGETPASPSTIPISELLLITGVGKEFYVHRTGVVWNGVGFETTFTAGEKIQTPQVEYSGLCRQFTGHRDWQNHPIPAAYRSWEKSED